MTATEPEIDLTRIEFPTDRLTIKDLRRSDPLGFDVEPPADPFLDRHLHRPLRRQSLDTILAAVLDSERILAEMAFKAALGHPAEADTRMGGKDIILESLSRDYVGLGIARGEHEAHELLRGIEAQAVAQARELGGRPR